MDASEVPRQSQGWYTGARAGVTMNPKKIVVAIFSAVLILSAGGCRKSGESTTTTQPAADAQPAAPTDAAPKQRLHRFFDNGVAPYIDSISPDTVVVHDGHAPMQKFTLAFEIDNSDKATKAEIQVDVPGIGEVHLSQIEIQPKGQVEFLLDASSFDLGPTVRLRAHCPSGDTDWLTLGDDPPAAPERLAGQGVPTISPLYIDTRHGKTGSAAVSIWSPEITRECTAEAKVDGQTVELRNVMAGDKRIGGQLLYSDLQGRSVAEHHFDVKLVVYGSGMPRADLVQLRFAE